MAISAEQCRCTAPRTDVRGYGCGGELLRLRDQSRSGEGPRNLTIAATEGRRGRLLTARGRHRNCPLSFAATWMIETGARGDL